VRPVEHDVSAANPLGRRVAETIRAAGVDYLAALDYAFQLVQAGVYGGVPIAAEGFRVAKKVLDERRAQGGV
jgi:hypothetical protein